jgi:hypothetical protein
MQQRTNCIHAKLLKTRFIKSRYCFIYTLISFVYVKCNVNLRDDRIRHENFVKQRTADG